VLTTNNSGSVNPTTAQVLWYREQEIALHVMNLHIRRKTPKNARWTASKSISVKDILRVSVCIERILPLKKTAQANYVWPFLYTEVAWQQDNGRLIRHPTVYWYWLICSLIAWNLGSWHYLTMLCNTVARWKFAFLLNVLDMPQQS
jgi:hypothetical protein